MRRCLCALLLVACSLDRTGLVGDAGRVPGMDSGMMERDGGVIRRDAGPNCVPVSPDDCDDVDDDCDSIVDEDFTGAACDSSDDDMCEDDLTVCVTGAVECRDDGERLSEREICDGEDNDCRSSTPDGAEDPMLALACDGDDAGSCEDGAIECSGGVLVCNDPDEGGDFDCDGADQDCDGTIDEDASCPCTHVIRGDDGHSYFFCTNDVDWDAARRECEARGYVLAHIDDAAENQWIADNVPTNEDYWIGATDSTTYSVEGTWVWYDDPAPRAEAPYRLWAGGQPNNSGSGENCAELDRDDNNGGVDGAWNDDDCDTTGGQAYACEASP